MKLKVWHYSKSQESLVNENDDEDCYIMSDCLSVVDRDFSNDFFDFDSDSHLFILKQLILKKINGLELTKLNKSKST